MDHGLRYVIYSLELHLFFARIMKEHALFLKVGFTPVNPSFAREAELYKQEFEKLLYYTIGLGNGIVRQNVLDSGEIVTEFTALAEQQTKRLTGIAINEELTAMELQLHCGENLLSNPKLCKQVKQLNQCAIRLLHGLIGLKERILSNVLSCCMFTMNYPLLIEHIMREAKLYLEYVTCLETNGDLNPQTMGQIEQFWNQIMMEHALFIRGLLDPSENDLIEAANSYAGDFARLLEQSCAAQDKTFSESALNKTQQFRDFKAAGVQGIEACKIRSVILPLLADHVLREANHYIRLLCE